MSENPFNKDQRIIEKRMGEGSGLSQETVPLDSDENWVPLDLKQAVGCAIETGLTLAAFLTVTGGVIYGVIYYVNNQELSEYALGATALGLLTFAVIRGVQGLKKN